jgi:hypothetical protein
MNGAGEGRECAGRRHAAFSDVPGVRRVQGEDGRAVRVSCGATRSWGSADPGTRPETFGVAPAFFSEPDTSRLVADLREALVGELAEARVSPSDLTDLAARMPGVAQVLLDLGRRNQLLAERLAGTADGRDAGREAPARRTRRSATSSTAARTTCTTPTSR